MIAVIYDPDTGVISNTIQSSPEIVAKNGYFVEVSEWRTDYDSNYLVRNGQLVLKSAVQNSPK